MDDINNDTYKEYTIREELVDMGCGDSVVFDDPNYDKAIIGVTTDQRVVYDYNLMVQQLADEDGITEEEAADFISYNTIRSLSYYPDENMPIIIYPI